MPAALFISHGGGPLPLLDDPSHREMVDTLRQIAVTVPTPAAIVVISAHWEEPVATVTAQTKPELIYDYYGFPPESYAITYPAIGNPRLAQECLQHFTTSGIPSAATETRGYDHGVFVPLKIMYPEASIPVVQISLLNNLSPQDHIEFGKALSNLPNDVLVIGSGFSFHNLQAFFASPSTEAQTLNAAFENWLIDTVQNPKLTADERERRLIQWEAAPGARFCHPREEHLLPLDVCYGAKQRACDQIYQFEVLNKKASAYYWSVNESA